MLKPLTNANFNPLKYVMIYKKSLVQRNFLFETPVSHKRSQESSSLAINVLKWFTLLVRILILEDLAGLFIRRLKCGMAGSKTH